MAISTKLEVVSCIVWVKMHSELSYFFAKETEKKAVKWARHQPPDGLWATGSGFSIRARTGVCV